MDTPLREKSVALDVPATVTTSVIVTPVSSPGVILVKASLVVPVELPAMASWSDVFALVSTSILI